MNRRTRLAILYWFIKIIMIACAAALVTFAVLFIYASVTGTSAFRR